MSRNPARRASAVLLGAAVCLTGARVDAASRASKRTAEELAQAVQTSRTLSQDVAPYDVVFRRDPMQPLVDGQGQWVSSSGLSSGLSVQGIIWSEQRPFAIVDDELYAPGAVVGPYTIVEIQEQGIVVQREGTRLVIPLDRGLEPQQAHADGPASLQALSPDVPSSPN